MMSLFKSATKSKLEKAKLQQVHQSDISSIKYHFE